MKAMILLLGFGGGAVALFQPLHGWAEARYGAGFGDLVNGSGAMGLLLLAGILSVVVLRARKRAEAAK